MIPLLRAALEGSLWLKDLGAGWAFLHQEWRFRDEVGQGKKSDVLAVHLPTGRLGIVEFKSAKADLPEARAQVAAYGRYWQRDGAELAPLFSRFLRAQGAAYGNPAAASASVKHVPAALFVGLATPGRSVDIKPVT